MAEEKTKDEKPEEVPSSGGRYIRNESGALEREPEPKSTEAEPEKQGDK